jgi:DnaJ family protein C protein 25
MTASVAISLLLFAGILVAMAEIYDPMNVFCGSLNCYEILGLNRTASTKDIKKAYRRLSLTQHPDKSNDPNATENFRLISKAYEVLDKNESKSNFDYYLDHPRDYFKVSGFHYMKNLPKSNVWLVLLVVFGLFSWFLHVVQYQKYEKVVKYLKVATLNNLSPKNGGSKQTMELHQSAVRRYNDYVKEAKAAGDKTAGKLKMNKDPAFEKIVDEVVAEVKIEGGYKKPEWKDLFILKLFKSPYTLYVWAQTYHRRYISTAPLPYEDREEMAMQKIGMHAWGDLSDTERREFIEREIWKPEVYAQYFEENDTGRDSEDEEMQPAPKPGFTKSMKKINKKRTKKND